MEIYNAAKTPRAAVGAEPRRRRPKDNIDLDMEDAERLGYGCHYGHYKADHPYTKDENEARLHPRKKQPQEQLRVRTVYEKTCVVCGKKFTTSQQRRKYCDDRCKYRSDAAKWRSSHPSK